MKAVPTNAAALPYLELDTVFAAGGAWLAPRDAIEAANWEGIAERARRSVAVAAKG